MKYKKGIILSIGLAILSTLALVGVANAQSFKAGSNITVPAKETIDSMLFAAGDNLDIAGTVNGDVYCAGQTITISGVVNGDVFCAGQSIVISGKIDGDARIAGQTTTISGLIGGSATVGSQDLIIEKTGKITRDLLGGSNNTTISGEIGRDIVAGASNLVINGKVSRNINGSIKNISVGSTGYIGGYLDYISRNELTIDSGGTVVGEITRTTPKNNEQNVSPFAFSIMWFIYVLLATLLMSLVLVLLFPNIFNEASSKALKNPGKTALIGFLACIAVPFMIMAMMFTIIGIPIAVLTIFIWIVIMMLNMPFSGYLLGSALAKKSKKPILTMLFGNGLLTVLLFIPIINFFAIMFSFIFGTGMILMEGKKLLAKPGKK